MTSKHLSLAAGLTLMFAGVAASAYRTHVRQSTAAAPSPVAAVSINQSLLMSPLHTPGEPVCVTCPDGRKFICVDGQFLCGIENSGCSVGSGTAGCPETGHRCMTTTGGNCQNNDWCQCDVAVSAASTPAHVNEAVTVSFTVKNQVGNVDGKFHTIIDSGGEIDWGDSEKTGVNKPDSITLQHTYKKTGTYTIKARIGGQFKWNAEGGSCSYNCQARGEASIRIYAAGEPKHVK